MCVKFFLLICLLLHVLSVCWLFGCRGQYTEVKSKPAWHGCGMAIIKFNQVSDCLNAIRELNNREIMLTEADMAEGHAQPLKVQLDLKTVITVPTTIYKRLKDEIDSVRIEIFKQKSKFPNITVNIVESTQKNNSHNNHNHHHNHHNNNNVNSNNHKNNNNSHNHTSHHSNGTKIVLYGTDSDAVRLARSWFNQLLTPIALNYDSEVKAYMIERGLQWCFDKNKGCFEKCWLFKPQSCMISIYCSSQQRAFVESIVKELENELECVTINLSPQFIGYLLHNCRETIEKTFFDKYDVTVNCDITNKTVEMFQLTKDKVGQIIENANHNIAKRLFEEEEQKNIQARDYPANRNGNINRNTNTNANRNDNRNRVGNAQNDVRLASRNSMGRGTCLMVYSISIWLYIICILLVLFLFFERG